MASRLDLHTLLTGIVPNAYFQPPPSVHMTYPCIVYKLDDIDTDFANNFPYNLQKGYKLTVIDQDPESSIPDEIAKLPQVSFDRFYTADNLNHYVFTIYF
jgi:hypothetical protein